MWWGALSIFSEGYESKSYGDPMGYTTPDRRLFFADVTTSKELEMRIYISPVSGPDLGH